jgi:O-antigen ligase
MWHWAGSLPRTDVNRPSATGWRGTLRVGAQSIQDSLGLGNRRTATINLWLLAFVFAAVAGWAVLWNRFQDPDPLRGRREMLADTVAMIHARPWAGFGLGTFRTAHPAYASVDFGAVVNHAHNDWAEWSADGGIPFGLLLLSIAIWSIPAGLRTVWGIGLIAVFIHSLVDFPLQKPVLELWLFTLLGIVAAETSPIAGPNRRHLPRRRN